MLRKADAIQSLDLDYLEIVAKKVARHLISIAV